jgi:hypothetical protein
VEVLGAEIISSFGAASCHYVALIINVHIMDTKRCNVAQAAAIVLRRDRPLHVKTLLICSIAGFLDDNAGGGIL